MNDTRVFGCPSLISELAEKYGKKAIRIEEVPAKDFPAIDKFLEKVKKHEKESEKIKIVFK